MPVGAVHPVEVAHAHQRRTEVRRHICEFVKGLHPNSSYRRVAEDAEKTLFKKNLGDLGVSAVDHHF
jgi:hypothetical protein